MSQVDELLSGMTDENLELYSADPEEEPHIVIGKDRHVTVPDVLKRLAVQFDHDVETVTFDCPRYWDEHDMSEWVIYINYTLADNTVGSYIAENIEAEGDIMRFTWTISRNVSNVKGNVSFLICIKNVDAEGNEINHWNSEPNRDCYISEGMACHEVVTEKYPDIITQILERIEGAEKSALISDTEGNLYSLSIVNEKLTLTKQEV